MLNQWNKHNHIISLNGPQFKLQVCFIWKTDVFHLVGKDQVWTSIVWSHWLSEPHLSSQLTSRSGREVRLPLEYPRLHSGKDLYCKAMHPAGTFEDNFFFSKWWDMWSFPGAHIWVSEVDKSKIWISTPKNQGSFWQNFVRWRRVWLGIWFLVVGGPQTLFQFTRHLYV